MRALAAIAMGPDRSKPDYYPPMGIKGQHMTAEKIKAVFAKTTGSIIIGVSISMIYVVTDYATASPKKNVCCIRKERTSSITLVET